ncbi:MAG: glycosyltransferase family 9 protein [Candidatus Omnitrophota bacterium]
MNKNIIIFAHSNIGDVCYDLVVVDPLRRVFPGAKISILTSSRAKNIAENYTGLDNIIVYDRARGARRLINHARFMMSLAAMQFDLAVALKNTVMPYFLGIPRVWKIRDKGIMRHPVDRNLEFLKARGVNAHQAVFGFSTGKEEDDFCDQFLKKHNIQSGDRIAGIFPIAAWSVKNWPVQKWNELADILKNRYKIKVIGFGKSNNDPYNRIVTENISRDIIWAETPTLKKAMALIGKCDVFIGPDSSLIHLASCMGCNVIALYGPTSPDYIYPYFHRHRIITPGIKLDCMPCYPGNNFCPCNAKYRTTVCMENITVADVLRLIDNDLQQQ